MANGNGTIGSSTRVTVGLLVAVAGLALAAVSGWTNVWALANQALPRAAAHETFVAKADYARDYNDLCARLARIEDKIDRLAEQRR